MKHLPFIAALLLVAPACDRKVVRDEPGEGGRKSSGIDGKTVRDDGRKKNETLVVPGEIESADVVTIRSPASDIIVALVADGTRVKQGDWLLTLGDVKTVEQGQASELTNNEKPRPSSRDGRIRITAPRDGIVFLAHIKPTGLREGFTIERGVRVRERQALLRMPDMNKRRFRMLVHPSKIDRVRRGQPVSLQFPALPKRTYSGRVKTILSKREPGRWPNYEILYFVVHISLDENGFELKPGLSGQAVIRIQPDMRR